MTSLSSLHREFIDHSNRPMNIGDHPGHPIVPSEPDVPIIAVERWMIMNDGHMTKDYVFRRPEDRPRFIRALLEYETATQHHALMIVSEDRVRLNLTTKNIDRITELDREYAKFADVLFKNIVYNP